VTICREWSLVKLQDPERHIRPLYCRSWGCEVCAPRRRTGLMAKAAAGNPSRFITLTVNPRIGENPDARLLLLANAWRNTCKRIKRRWPDKPFSYLAIVESTKAGEPHLHILWRGPYVPQKFLSDCMAELIESPIVDIRKIKGLKEVIRYVAKYVTKNPHHFGTGKRYWSSQDWEPKADTTDDGEPKAEPAWQVMREDVFTLVWRWSHEGFAARKEGNDGIYAIFIEQPP